MACVVHLPLGQFAPRGEDLSKKKPDHVLTTLARVMLRD